MSDMASKLKMIQASLQSTEHISQSDSPEEDSHPTDQPPRAESDQSPQSDSTAEDTSHHVQSPQSDSTAEETPPHDQSTLSTAEETPLHEQSPQPVIEGTPLPAPIYPTHGEGAGLPSNDPPSDHEHSDETSSAGPTYGFDPFEPAGGQAEDDSSQVDGETHDQPGLDAHGPDLANLPTEHPSRPFLLPTPPPHQRIKWVDGCACQQYSIPHQRSNRRKGRKRKQRSTRTPQSSPPPSSEELLIDLN